MGERSDVKKYLTWQLHGSIDLTRKISLSDISKYDNSSHYQWAIVLKTLNEPIGGINVVKIDETCKCFEVNYRIGKSVVESVKRQGDGSCVRPDT